MQLEEQLENTNNNDEQMSMEELFDNVVEEEIGHVDYNDIPEDAAQTKNENNKNQPYELILSHKLSETEKPFDKVVGHENQKKELLNVINWFKNSKKLKAQGLSIARACLLYGAPGNGKTLCLKEIIRCCEAPVVVFKGSKENAVVEGIIDSFKKAREMGHAIVVFDELDLLINKERRVIRALQECMDGVESDDDILVLAATNDIDSIPDALLRHGRFEKIVNIPYPTGKEALQLFKKHMKEFNVKLPSDFDDDEMELSLNGISCAGIKSLVNDILLRNGFENITTEMIDDSIYNITDRIKTSEEDSNREIAIHECSHAVVAKQFSQFFDINRLNISGASGVFHAREVEKDFWPYEKVIASIKISMAGTIGQKVLCGRGTRGNEDDLQKARTYAYNLINMCGYSSCWETLPTMRPGARVETSIKRRRMERKIERLLKKCEREVYKIVKNNKDKINALADLLFEKKHLKSSEILAVIG